jgi:hypothetical protein
VSIASDVQELVDALTEVTGWLEGSDVYSNSHGAHTAGVEARKLLERLGNDEDDN